MPPRKRSDLKRIKRPSRGRAFTIKISSIRRIHEATERTMVLDDSLTIRECAVVVGPTAWQDQNLRDILVSLSYDVDTPLASPTEKGQRLDPV